MNYRLQLLLVGAVTSVGVLHTLVPDHWVPITLIARQRGWSKGETARAALQAGIGHVLSTLLIALIVWLAGAAFAQRFGHIVDTVSSLALIAFGNWFAISAWRDLRKHGGHGHSRGHDFPHLHGSEEGHDHDGHWPLATGDKTSPACRRPPPRQHRRRAPYRETAAWKPARAIPVLVSA
jgi:ABC-type nickel/cobalt efflux system permease component RcnA